MSSNKTKYLKTIDKSITNIQEYKVGDVVRICMSGYFKIVGFTNKDKFVIKKVMTDSFKVPDREVYDSFYIWSIERKVDKEEMMNMLNNAIELTKEIYGE